MNFSTAAKYSSRDGATAKLRSLGITKQDYDDFISRRDGTYYVDVIGATAHGGKAAEKEVQDDKPMRHNSSLPDPLPADKKPVVKLAERLKAEKVKIAKVAKAAANKVAEAARIAANKVDVKPAGGRPISVIIREMIRGGCTNQQVWDTLGPNGSGLLSAKQVSYASWFRCEMRRKGEQV